MNPRERHFARRIIMQALYEKETSNNPNQVIIAGFLIDNQKLKFDRSYFQTTFIEVSENKQELDEYIKKYIDRDFADLDPVSLAILRLATFELKSKLDIPYKVVINEAVNLAKSFGCTDSHKFVNATLDKLAKELRVSETGAK